MESYPPIAINRAMTESLSQASDTLEENYFGVEAEKGREIPELVHVRLGAQNLTDKYVERVEVRNFTPLGKKIYLGTSFYERSEVPFLSTFRHPNYSKFLIAAQRSDKTFFTIVEISRDTAVNINVEKESVVAEVYAFNSKKDFWAKTSRVLKEAYVLNESSAKSIDDIHPLM